ncbi:hypothetical protein INR49_029681 [Caranx melampygus]|nr:hypothetical protein INR49_029681 [Caranx melampygus]
MPPSSASDMAEGSPARSTAYPPLRCSALSPRCFAPKINKYDESSIGQKYLCSQSAPVSNLQISIWLEYPKAIAAGINRWQFGLRVTHLHVEMGQEQEHKSRDIKGTIQQTISIVSQQQQRSYSLMLLLMFLKLNYQIWIACKISTYPCSFSCVD